MLRPRSILIAAAALAVCALPANAANKKKSTYRGCPAGLTFAPDLLKSVSWARSAYGWGSLGPGYRPPKEWKCKS